MDKKDLHLLIVIQQGEMRAIIRDYLRADGFARLSLSENGQSAFRRISQDHPDLVIADDDLPGLSGLDLLKEVRQDKTLTELPFIILSAETQQKHVARAFETGVSAYIVKPFSNQVLIDKVNHLLQRRLFPDDLDQLYRDANRLAQAGDLNEALTRYEQALASAERAAAAIHHKIGQVHEVLNREKEAESDYRQAIDLSRQFTAAHDALAELMLTENRPDEALVHLKPSLNVSPLNAKRQMLLGEAYLASDAFDLAEKAFRQALELDPSQAHALNRLGIALRRAGKTEEALTYLLKALEASPEDENLLYNVSRAYWSLNQKQAAVEHLEKALRLNPDFQEGIDLMLEIAKVDR